MAGRYCRLLDLTHGPRLSEVVRYSQCHTGRMVVERQVWRASDVQVSRAIDRRVCSFCSPTARSLAQGCIAD
jgi:hypothetical protein